MEALMMLCVLCVMADTALSAAVLALVLPGRVRHIRREEASAEPGEEAKEEARRSRAMEEGIANLMGYTVRGMSGFEKGGES